MSQNRERELLHELDKIAFIASGIAIVGLSIIYFLVATSDLIEVVRDFILGLILNLIPVLLIFVISYALLRRIQTIKSEREIDELVERIVGETQTVVNKELIAQVASKSATKDLLVQHEDTKVIYMIDHVGLRRPISDEDTARYFLEVLGYQQDDVPQVSPDSLRPIGPEVVAFRRWHPPRTKEDDMSSEARNSLKLLKRRVRSENGVKVLAFYIRNNSEHSMQITSAKLILDIGAPLTANDISPKNLPTAPGLITCKLLFNGESGSRELAPLEEATLDLFLTRNLAPNEEAMIESVNLGYIEIKGVFQDTAINFHLH